MARREQDTKLLDVWQEAGAEGDDGVRRVPTGTYRRHRDLRRSLVVGYHDVHGPAQHSDS